MEKRLYVVIHPIGALIGSQLSPEEFASHYMFGSFKHYEGKLIFAEIDPNYRNPYFEINKALETVVPHEDNRPKATKFIKSYRVLEHIELEAYKSLYLVNPDASMIELKSSPLDEVRHESNLIRLYVEIAPLRILTLSNLNFKDFGETLANDTMKGAPIICFSQIELDADMYLHDIIKNPFITSPLPGIHPVKLKEAIEEMKTHPNKKTKGLSLSTHFDSLSYKHIRHGIIISTNKKTIAFKIPSLSEIEKINLKFWRAM